MKANENSDIKLLYKYSVYTKDNHLFQVSFPTSWSLCLRSGIVSPNPVCSARPWWATCTRTRLAGAAFNTHAHFHTCRLTPMLMRLILKEKIERKKTSLNASLFFLGCFIFLYTWSGEVFIQLRLNSPAYFLPQLVAHRLTGSGSTRRGVWPGYMRNVSLCWSWGGLQHCRKKKWRKIHDGADRW